MKRWLLERHLAALGWHGAKHDVWRRGEHTEVVPRHTEINEQLAIAILARARRKE